MLCQILVPTINFNLVFTEILTPFLRILCLRWTPEASWYCAKLVCLLGLWFRRLGVFLIPQAKPQVRVSPLDVVIDVRNNIHFQTGKLHSCIVVSCLSCGGKAVGCGDDVFFNFNLSDKMVTR